MMGGEMAFARALAPVSRQDVLQARTSTAARTRAELSTDVTSIRAVSKKIIQLCDHIDYGGPGYDYIFLRNRGGRFEAERTSDGRIQATEGGIFEYHNAAGDILSLKERNAKRRKIWTEELKATFPENWQAIRPKVKEILRFLEFIEPIIHRNEMLVSNMNSGYHPALWGLGRKYRNSGTDEETTRFATKLVLLKIANDSAELIRITNHWYSMDDRGGTTYFDKNPAILNAVRTIITPLADKRGEINGNGIEKILNGEAANIRPERFVEAILNDQIKLKIPETAPRFS